MSISGLMVIRNGIRLGYPFVEAIASILKLCDEYIIVDYYSDDGTYEILLKLSYKNNKIKLLRSKWPQHSACGSAIAVATNEAMSLCNNNKIFYQQADEVYHENSLPHLYKFINLKTAKSVSFKFLHFRNGFNKIISNPTYNEALRIVSKEAHSIQDGFNFSGKIMPILKSDVHIWHVGWCFPWNICQKHVSHAALYPGVGGYENAKRICEDMLRSGNIDVNRLIHEIDRNYKLIHNKHGLPRYLKHLINDKQYNPEKSIEVLHKDIT